MGGVAPETMGVRTALWRVEERDLPMYKDTKVVTFPTGSLHSFFSAHSNLIEASRRGRWREEELMK